MMKAAAIFMAIAVGMVFPVSAQRPEPGTTTALYKEATTENFRRIKAAGIEWVEVALNQCYRGVAMEQIVPRIEAMKAMADSAGLKVWSIHLPFSRTLDISVLDDSLRRENVAFMAKMIRKSAIFAPQRLVLHPSSEPIPDEDRGQRIANAISSIRELKRAADGIGVELCIENLPRTCLGRDSGELMRLIADYPEVMVCFDSNHLLKEEHAHFFEAVGNRIGTIHASDYDRKDERHWLPGEGVIDWPDFLRRLQASGYKGVFMHEVRAGETATPENIVKTYNEVILGNKKK